MMPKRFGSSVNENSVSFVRNGTSFRPGIGGAAARAPVAMTALTNRRICPATSIVSGPVNRPAPRNTSTPSSVNLLAESCGLMAALRLTRDKSTGAPFPDDVDIGMVCRNHCFREGVIMRAVGDRMIVAPPLVITRAQIDEMVSLILRCLDLTLADARRQGWLA